MRLIGARIPASIGSGIGSVPGQLIAAVHRVDAAAVVLVGVEHQAPGRGQSAGLSEVTPLTPVSRLGDLPRRAAGAERHAVDVRHALVIRQEEQRVRRCSTAG